MSEDPKGMEPEDLAPQNTPDSPPAVSPTPALSDVEPPEPKPSEPEPSEPKPSEPEPSEPEPSGPEPSESKPSESWPPEPKPSAPEPQVEASAQERPRRRENLILVRYGKMHHRGFFSTHLVDAHVGETFIIRSKRGTEWGTMISLCPADQESPPVHGRVLRRATADDLIKVQEIENTQRFDELRLCREKVEEHGLSMKLVDVEHLLGSEKIIFYFTANGRVDFRGLVKNLAQTLKTRIELKQIGVRDEARILGLVGHCGRSLCCRQYMREIEQVTMKMAKIQKSTLDPSKISGACGRLMCCLRYEDEVYRDLRKNSIPRGRRVWTEEEEVEVLDFQILSQKIFVQNIRGERRTIKLDEVLPPGVFPKKKEPVEAAPVRPRGERRPKPTGESPGPRGERRPKPTGESSGPRGERRPKPKGESPGPRGEQRPKPTGGSSTPPGEAPRRKKKKKRRRRRPGGQGGQADGNRSGSGGGGGSRPSQPRDSGGRSGGHGTPSPGKPGRPDRPSPGSDAGR